MEDIFISGSIVSLRKPNIEQDIVQGEWHQWFNDAEITKYLVHGLFPNDRESQKELVESELKQNSTLLLSIISNTTGKMIGVISLKCIDLFQRNAEIGMVLGFDKEPGSAIEAMALLTQHAFDRLNLIKLYAGTNENLWKWYNTLETIGYKIEGLRRNIGMRNGESFDAILSAIDKEDYYALKKIRGGKLIKSIDELYTIRRSNNKVMACREFFTQLNDMKFEE